MAVLFHAGNGNGKIAAVLDEGQQLFVQILRIPAKVIVGVRADHSIKEFHFKGECGSVSLDGNDPAAVNAHGVEESAVLRRGASQVCCIDGKAILLYKKCAG